jgi:hypothetical protein
MFFELLYQPLTARLLSFSFNKLPFSVSHLVYSGVYIDFPNQIGVSRLLFKYNLYEIKI